MGITVVRLGRAHEGAYKCTTSIDDSNSDYKLNPPAAPGCNHFAFRDLWSCNVAFEPTSNYNPDLPQMVVAAIIAFTLVPVVAIWIPRKAALILGGVVLLPPAVIALFLIWAEPTGGLIASLPIGLWYFGAVYIWKRL